MVGIVVVFIFLGYGLVLIELILAGGKILPCLSISIRYK